MKERSKSGRALSADRFAPLDFQEFAALQRAVFDLNQFRDLRGFTKALPRILRQVFCGSSGLADAMLELADPRAPYSLAQRRAGSKANRPLSRSPLRNARAHPSSDSSCSPRDRLVLEWLRPHAIQARQNAESLSRLVRRRCNPDAIRSLTEREAEVASWLAQGKSNPEIALILGTRPRTIEKHVEHILSKLAVENRASVAALVARGAKTQTVHPPNRIIHFTPGNDAPTKGRRLISPTPSA